MKQDELVFFLPNDNTKEMVYISIRMNGFEQKISVPYTQRNKYKTRRYND
jgi:hypothetical protein